MKAIELIASAINRKDDVPNLQLAEEIVKSDNSGWVKELVENLGNKDKNIQSDCIKVIYETGERGGARLIAPYYKTFAEILGSKNNRLVWGAMYALDTIASVSPVEVYSVLPAILKAIDSGSVITIDGGVSILAKLAATKEFAPQAFPLLLEQLRRCPAKQLPMYAEKAVKAINAGNKNEFVGLLQNRYSELEKDTQKKRVDKVLKNIK